MRPASRNHGFLLIELNFSGDGSKTTRFWNLRGEPNTSLRQPTRSKGFRTLSGAFRQRERIGSAQGNIYEEEGNGS